MQNNNYSLLLEKLDLFIRKFYFNKLIRGVLFTTALLFAYFLIIALAEYQFYFSPALRKILFFSFVATGLFALVYFIIVPVLKIQKLGKIISHQQAADIIGKHFTNVKDKLINILQLKNAEVSLEQAALVEASINQKSLELKPIPFTNAIDLNENRQYLKYAIPPFLIFMALLFFKPNILADSTNRLIKNDIIFERPMPFRFVVNTDSLNSLQFEDFKLNIKIEGEEIPAEIFLYRKTENSEFTKSSPQKLNATNYAYIFSNIQANTKFYLEASGFRSKDFEIDVFQKSMITKFVIELDYPKYLNRPKEIIKNSGDINVPFGTSVKWIFDAVATEKINIKFSDASFNLNKQKNNQFIYSKVLKTNDKYVIKTLNNNTFQKDSVQFNISVEMDEFPKIEVTEKQDSTNDAVYFYIGEISDDYGLTKLTFNYKIEKADSKEKTEKIVSQVIPFEKGLISSFSHYWNIKQLGLKPGDKLSYFFQVWDNDGVNGSKFSRSRWMKIEVPTVDEFEDKTEKELDDLKKELTKAIEKTKDIQKEMKNFKEKLLNKKELSWEDKKQMQQMLDEQKKLQKNIEEMNKKLKENIQQQSEYKEINEEIAKKQEQVQKLFDEVLDEEMKALIEKYEEMLKELDKENALEKTEEMQVNDEELEKELDRMLEMLKKLEFEQKMQETQEKLEKLAEKQEELSKDDKKTSEEKKAEQEKLNDDFEKVKEDIEKLDKLDEELGDKANMEDLKKEGEETSDEMEKASEQLEKSKESKASDSQKAAAEKMKSMASKMAAMNMKMQSKSMEEDMASLRQLLENLIKLSFEEERLLDEFKITSANTPKYIKLTQDQNKLIDNSKLVEDSLFALAKRVFQIEKFVTEKIFDINRNLKEAVDYLEDRQVQKAVVNQQYAMTGYNDLALMLSEVLQQMQAQMAQQMPGNQSCEKPGDGKPKPGKLPGLKEMQQQLSDQISKMGEQMKKDGEGKPGSQSGQSKELAKMAAKQQAIREALQKIKNGDTKGEDGKGSLGDLQKIIDQMEQNETDIVNKNISSELIKRQQDILTRLLEAENAERQRDEKKERKSEVARDFKQDAPPELKDYLKKRNSALNLYMKTQPNLRPFYRSISEKYFKNSADN